MPDTFKVAILKFIPKNDKKVKSKNDLRSISLTNYEYRIWTKVLFLRCKRVSEFYFSDVQTCSIPGRRIHDNLIAIRDILVNSNEIFSRKLIILKILSNKWSLRVKSINTCLRHLSSSI